MVRPKPGGLRWSVRTLQGGWSVRTLQGGSVHKRMTQVIRFKNY
jgi:hypothetical protein